jgi:hypothetical protein
MTATGYGRGLLVFALVFVALSPEAAAQSAISGAIAGVVRDMSGGVVPGVTVEVASPALIEKLRTAVTDAQGNYKVTDLRPGVYSVTFKLGGFTTVRREGIELTTGFTASANAELKVGGFGETVTVTSATPVVDVYNTRQTNVITQETLQALPTNKNVQGFAALTVGVTVDAGSLDVGGNRHEQGTITMNGGPPMKTLLDGMIFNNLGTTGDGQLGSYAVNVAFITEVGLELGGIGAESKTGGVNINYVPRDGGNRWSGLLDLEFGNGALQSSNLNNEMKRRGVTSAAEAKRLYDYSGGLGGRIKRDRLWFFVAGRYNGSQEYSPTLFYNAAQGKYVGDPNSGVSAYIPDPTRRAYQDPHFTDGSIRLAWQATRTNKITFNNSFQKSCVCFREVTQSVTPVAPEANVHAHFNPVNLAQATWSNTVTSRLLIDAGVSHLYDNNDLERPDGTTPNDISITESLGTATVPSGLRYGSKGLSTLPNPFDYGYAKTKMWNGRVAASYIPGSHSIKIGYQFLRGDSESFNDYGRAVAYTFRGGSASSITQFATPIYALIKIREDAVYGQDQWTWRRLTLNLGARYDFFTGSIPTQTKPPGRFSPAIATPEISGESVPRWHTIAPRVGAAYDVFGNGKTAVKGSLGKYLASSASSALTGYHLGLSIATSASRSWTDDDLDFVPDCDLTSVVRNGECGDLSNSRFGQAIPSTKRDPVLLTADGRGYNWQGSIGIQHQLRDRWGIDVSYNRTWYGNFTVTDNLLVSPADYDTYCVTAPIDPRLPDGGGYPICGLYDLKRDKVGQVDNLVTVQSKFGERTQVYNGVRVSTNARFRQGAMLGGGFNIGRTRNTNCSIVDVPNTSTATLAPGAVTPPDFCDTVPPWSKSLQFRVNGVLPLPWWGLQTSAAFQIIPGVPLDATRSYSNAEIVPSLKRNLSSATAVTVPLYAPGVTLFEPYITQLDWRFSKVARIGGYRLEGDLDVFNALNTNAALSVNSSYGTTWQRPTATLAGRTIRIGGKLSF